MKTQRADVELELVEGNITQQPDMAAIVNAANAELLIGGGVAGAIHRAAGPGLEKECAPLAPIKPGEAVITGAHQLPNQYVIHCLGPVYGRDKPEDRLLANCYRNALKLAEDEGIGSIAFPAISTGAFGYPIGEAVQVCLDTILEEMPYLDKLQKIRLVLFSNQDLEVHQEYLKTKEQQ